MSGTDNLALTQLTEGQASPEVGVNDKGGELDSALTEQLACSMASGNVTVTSLQYRRNILFRGTAVGTTGRSITLPAVKRLVVVEADAANTNTFALVRGSTSIALTPGRTYLVVTDGTTDGLTARDIGGTALVRDIAGYIPGTMVNAQLLLRFNVLRPFSIPANAVGSYLTSSAAATASTAIVFKKNTVTFLTATIAISGTSATFSSSLTSFAAGDLITVHGPATADATVADTAFSILGNG